MKLVLAWFLFIFSISDSKKTHVKNKQTMPLQKVMTCKEFGQTARFNPHSVTSDRWLIFYYYGPYMPATVISFRVPSRREISYLHFLFDGHLYDDFDWKANMLIKFNENNNQTVLLVERNYKGSFWVYIPMVGLQLGQYVPRFDVQMKQTKDNKYIAYMTCEDRTVYIMARLNDVPPKAKIVEEAAKLGYSGRLGKSYLYRGSQWMPIGDSDESDYWRAGFSPTERMERATQEIYQNSTELVE